MADKDLEDDEIWDADLHDVETVQYKVHPSKRSDQVTITMHDKEGGPFTLIKIYGSCLKLADQIKRELDIMDEDDGEH